jgi:hypothetical protein
MFPLLPFHGRELAALYAEIARYLTTVDLFRREGCVLQWRPESRR